MRTICLRRRRNCFLEHVFRTHQQVKIVSSYFCLVGIDRWNWREVCYFFCILQWIHLHIHNDAILHRILSQRSLQLKAAFLKDTTRADIMCERLRKEPDDIGIAKDILTYLSDGTRSKSFSPIGFCNIITYFSRFRMYMLWRNAAILPIALSSTVMANEK